MFFMRITGFFLFIVFQICSLNIACSEENPLKSKMYIGKDSIENIAFNGFAGAYKHISLNGTAVFIENDFGSDKKHNIILRLTPRRPNTGGYVAGSAFIKYPFRGFQNDYAFSTFFRFRITGSNLYDGSGLVFVVHSDRRYDKALGKCEYCMGFAGNNLISKSVKPSIGIEFDAHRNSWDYDYNLVGLNFHGSKKSKHLHFGTFIPNSRSKRSETPYTDAPLNNGKAWNVWIDYKNNGIIEVRSSQQNKRELATLHLRRYINLLDSMSLRKGKFEDLEPIVYVGFTADPGLFPAYNDILEWYFRPCALPYGDYLGNKIGNQDNKLEDSTIKCN